MPNARWRELSTRQKGSVVLLGAAQLGLLVAALADIRRRPAEGIRGSKKLWVAASFVNYAGPIAYFLIGRRR